MIHADWTLISQIIVSASEGAKQPSIIYVDWTILYQAGLFLALMAFLGKVLFAPMLKVFEAREQAHLSPEKTARELTALAAQATESYNKVKEEALSTAERIRAELSKDAGERQKAMISEARQQAEKILAEARAQLAESGARLKEELPGRAESLAGMLADRLLGR